MPSPVSLFRILGRQVNIAEHEDPYFLKLLRMVNGRSSTVHASHYSFSIASGDLDSETSSHPVSSACVTCSLHSTKHPLKPERGK